MPEYEKLFRGAGIAAMGEAVVDALFLLNRGHSLRRATYFVMEHYQLSNAQRIALTRGLCTDEEILRRRKNKLCRDDVAGKTVYIDGFNAIILMESVVSGSPIFRCMDGAVRDLANLKGSYHIIDKTEAGIRLILAELDSLGVERAVINIDSPVSNSRNLKSLICEIAGEYSVDVEVELVNACDVSFYGLKGVISGDGIVMDHASSWIPMYLWIIEKYMDEHDVWMVDFDGMSRAYREFRPEDI